MLKVLVQKEDHGPFSPLLLQLQQLQAVFFQNKVLLLYLSFVFKFPNELKLQVKPG